MILSKKSILKALQNRDIKIEPFDPNNLQPNSYDLSLHPKLKVYTKPVLDVKENNPSKDFVIPESGFILHPGELYIGMTNEYTENSGFLPMLHGKSSLARLGIHIHVCAGVGDLGFKGHWVLEIVATKPVKIYPNMKIAQVVYHTVTEVNKEDEYKGKYQNTKEILASKSFEDFKS